VRKRERRRSLFRNKLSMSRFQKRRGGKESDSKPGGQTRAGSREQEKKKKDISAKGKKKADKSCCANVRRKQQTRGRFPWGNPHVGQRGRKGALSSKGEKGEGKTPVGSIWKKCGKKSESGHLFHTNTFVHLAFGHKSAWKDTKTINC